MKKYTLLAALCPCVLLAEAWRPSEFEIKGWLQTVPATNVSDSVFSPIGLAISMAMLGEGTGGEHRADIAEALGLLGDFGSTFSYLFASYAESSASNTVSVAIAPSLWSRNIRKMDIAYRQSLMCNFGAGTGSLASTLPINAWTEAKTEGRIPEIVTEIPPRTDLMLLNAVAFEGAWQTGFNPSRTTSAEFRPDGAAAVKVPMMHGEAIATRLVTDTFTAIRIPFAVKGFHMVYMLPPAGVGLAKLRAQFGENLSIDEVKSRLRAGMGEGLTRLQLKLEIPKMEIRSSWNLVPMMAMCKVPVSGYSRIGEDFRVDQIIQAAYVKVSETGYSLTPGVRPEEKKKKEARRSIWRRADEENDGSGEPERLSPATESFTLNRPFIFFVWDENTDTILLVGQFTGRK